MSLSACEILHPNPTANSLRGVPKDFTCPCTWRAIHIEVWPSGMVATWRVMRLGVSNARWMTHNGQDPPEREKWNEVADWRLEIFPARSVRIKTKGTPRAPGRCSVVKRCA